MVLVVKILAKQSDLGCNRSEMIASLAAVPEKLHDLFANILEKVDSTLVAAMQWMLFARNPLTLLELYFAIRTSLAQKCTRSWNPAEVDEDSMKCFVLHATRGLVEFTKRSFWNDNDTMNRISAVTHGDIPSLSSSMSL